MARSGCLDPRRLAALAPFLPRSILILRCSLSARKRETTPLGPCKLYDSSGEAVVPRQHRLENEPMERSEEHTSELQSLMRISYAVFCLKKQIESSQPYQMMTL